MYKNLLYPFLAALPFMASACLNDAQPQKALASSSSSLGSSSSISAESQIRVGYWPYYTPAPSDSLLQYFNHVMVFSITPNEESKIDSSHIDESALADLVRRAHAKGVKVGLSVGGYGMSENFPALAADPQKREEFAKALVAFARNRSLDGIDLDWEYPDTTQGQNIHYRDLIGAVRRASLPAGLSLSINVHRVSSHFANLNPDSVDWIQIMSYDQSKGVRNGYTSKGENGNFQESMEQLQFWHEKVGFPKNKIVLGMPAYAVSLKDGNALTILAYKDFTMDPLSDSVLVDGTMLYMGGPNSCARKSQYLRQNGYKGYMFWEMSQDQGGEASLFQSAWKASQ